MISGYLLVSKIIVLLGKSFEIQCMTKSKTFLTFTSMHLRVFILSNGIRSKSRSTQCDTMCVDEKVMTRVWRPLRLASHSYHLRSRAINVQVGSLDAPQHICHKTCAFSSVNIPTL